jgi:uncharacterized protein YbjT (DUF2867 family)
MSTSDEGSFKRRTVFITGGTGYLGRHLIPELLRKNHCVRALVRAGSEGKLPRDCTSLVGDALESSSFAHLIRPADTFVQLLGVPRPSPAKAKEFRAIDLRSISASVAAAAEAGVGHFIYVSVAQPAPIMKAYLQVRAEGEQLLRESGLPATILRPWYVLGPGHRWPYLLLPAYKVMEFLPATREAALRLGLVKLRHMVNTLIASVEAGAGEGVKTLGVQEIKSC